jgi:dipeptidyl aminopeptidase/acylaminoacyl peptidase
VDSGPALNLTVDNPADDTNPRYSPDGRLLAFGRQLIRDFYADRVRLTVFDRRTRETRSLGGEWDRSATEFVWSPDSRALFGTAEDAGSRRVFRFDLSGSAPAAVTQGTSYSDLAIAGNGPVIVALRSSFTEPPALVSVIPRTGAATRLADFNDVALARLAQGRAESVQYSGANGDPVQMWVVYPPGFTPERRWPLLMLLHGGPHDSVTDAMQWRWNAQVFAGWGYVVAWPNFHGSSGFGQAFAEAAAGEWAELPYQDTVRAADWFASQPWIDPERMAAGGGSYGGYLAAILLGRKHPFRTLIAHAPVYDLFGQYASDKGANLRRFGEQWTDRERFERNSPHLAAGQFSTPTLVIHGELDRRVPVAQGLALFNTLQNRGIESRLLYFPDENHWIEKPQNSLFWYASIREWLERHVAPGPGATATATSTTAAP